MPDLKKAAQQALEALEELNGWQSLAPPVASQVGRHAAINLRAALEQLDQGGKTGWPPGLLQDDCRGLSKWLASQPDARRRVREAVAALEQPEQDVPETDCGNMQWADIPKEFNDWWDADRLTQTNPFREDSPAYWAWEGWQARAALEQTVQGPLSDEELDRLWREPMSADWEHREYARAVEAAHGIKEKNHEQM
jgi:hypothetical protein